MLLDLLFFFISYLRDVFLTIAFQFEPTTTTSAATSHATSVSTCTIRDLLQVFAILSLATTYCKLDLWT